MNSLEVGKYLIVDPRICHGKLTFRGTRVPVNTVLTFLARGETIEAILEGWPELKPEAIKEAILLAAAAWPELLRPEIEAAIRRLGAVVKRGGQRGQTARESNHSRQPA